MTTTNNHLTTLRTCDDFRSIWGKGWHKFVIWVWKVALKSSLISTASQGIFKSSYRFMSHHYVTRAHIQWYATAAQLIFTQVYKWQLVQHRPCSNVVNPNPIFNCRAKIKTCLNKRNTYRIGSNYILKCTANGLLSTACRWHCNATTQIDGVTSKNAKWRLWVTLTTLGHQTLTQSKFWFRHVSIKRTNLQKSSTGRAGIHRPTVMSVERSVTKGQSPGYIYLCAVSLRFPCILCLMQLDLLSNGNVDDLIKISFETLHTFENTLPTNWVGCQRSNVDI